MPSPFAREGEGEQLLQHVGIPATRSIDVLVILMVHRLTWQIIRSNVLACAWRPVCMASVVTT